MPNHKTKIFLSFNEWIGLNKNNKLFFKRPHLGLDILIFIWKFFFQLIELKKNYCWSLMTAFKIFILDSFFIDIQSTRLLHCLLVTLPKQILPSISVSKNFLIIVTSWFGSICRSINLLSSIVKIVLIFRPSIVVCIIAWPGTNFCCWVLNGTLVFKEYSFSLNLTICVVAGSAFAIFLVIML